MLVTWPPFWKAALGRGKVAKRQANYVQTVADQI